MEAPNLSEDKIKLINDIPPFQEAIDLTEAARLLPDPLGLIKKMTDKQFYEYSLFSICSMYADALKNGGNVPEKVAYAAMYCYTKLKTINASTN